MQTVPKDISNLSVEEKVNLFLALKSDIAVKQYLYDEISHEILKEEIARRDDAFKNGNLYLTSIDDLQTRLKIRRDGL